MGFKEFSYFYEPFSKIGEDIGKIFKDNVFAFADVGARWKNYLKNYPLINLYEDGNNVVVVAELGGVTPQDVDVTIEEDFLKIKGELKIGEGIDSKNYLKREIGQGPFERKIELPYAVDGDNVKAKYINGLLKITLPRKEVEKGRKVDIEIED